MNPNDLQKTIEIIKTEISPLADKIGQGAGWTYELFVRQVYVNAFVGLLWIPVGILMAIIAKKLLPLTQDRKDGDGNTICGELTWWFIIVPLLILSLITILDPISGLIKASVNPNYQAIKLIIGTITPPSSN